MRLRLLAWCAVFAAACSSNSVGLGNGMPDGGDRGSDGQDGARGDGTTEGTADATTGDADGPRPEPPADAPRSDAPPDAPGEAPVLDPPPDLPLDSPTTDAPIDSPADPPPPDLPLDSPTTDAPIDPPVDLPPPDLPVDLPVDPPIDPPPPDLPVDPPSDPPPPDLPADPPPSEGPAACGNGTLQPGEICDDGNTLDGDGCSHNCRHEGCADGTREGFVNYGSFPDVAGCGPAAAFADGRDTAAIVCATGWSLCGPAQIGALAASPPPAAGFTCAWLLYTPATCDTVPIYSMPACKGLAALGGIDAAGSGMGSCSACPSAGYQLVTGPAYWSGSTLVDLGCTEHTGLACGKTSGASCLLACCRP